MYPLTETHFRIIAASFMQAYPDATLLRANDKADYPMLALVGWKHGGFDLSTLAGNCAALKELDSVDDEELYDPNTVGRMHLGRLNASLLSEVPLNTLDNARIEILAGRRKVTRNPRQRDSSDVGQEPYLVDDAWSEFEKRLPGLLK